LVGPGLEYFRTMGLNNGELGRSLNIVGPGV